MNDFLEFLARLLAAVVYWVVLLPLLWIVSTPVILGTAAFSTKVMERL
jgi:hypothetical protein